MNDITATLTSASTSSNYYTVSDSWNTSPAFNLVDLLLSKEQREELLMKLLESEDELMPILKKYLVGYLDKIMDNPGEIIKELLKEKDTEIESLKKKVSDLEEKVNKASFTPYPYYPSNIPLGPNPFEGSWSDNMNGITTWSDIYSSSSSSTMTV